MNFTVCTAFYDIKRENWSNYNRKLESYLQHFSNVLSLQVNMVIFIEKKFENFVKSLRDSFFKSEKPVKTTIIVLELNELYMYQYLDIIKNIQTSPDYSIGHPNPIAPELTNSLYDIIMSSKMNLVYRASIIDTESDYYIWMDAGFTHGNIKMSNINWNPTTLFVENKICMIALQSLEVANDDPKKFFLQYTDVVIGSVFSVHKNVIDTVHTLYNNLFVELFSLNIVDDDQYYSTILAKRHPELVKIVIGNWYDAIYY